MTNIGIKPSIAKAVLLNKRFDRILIINKIPNPDIYFFRFSINSTFSFFITLTILIFYNRYMQKSI
jgi:hypothetical protein